jgi:hypothetical protein
MLSPRAPGLVSDYRKVIETTARAKNCDNCPQDYERRLAVYDGPRANLYGVSRSDQTDFHSVEANAIAHKHGVGELGRKSDAPSLYIEPVYFGIWIGGLRPTATWSEGRPGTAGSCRRRRRSRSARPSWSCRSARPSWSCRSARPPWSRRCYRRGWSRIAGGIFVSSAHPPRELYCDELRRAV